MLNVITVTSRPAADAQDGGVEADADAIPVAARAAAAVNAAAVINAHLFQTRDTPHLRITQKTNANSRRPEGG
ncbi:hypothetical protein ACFVH0_27475 [Streptomyces sp. NPDC127117]|uniref:hypothetical protein n=1 Tax=Streptomyces sp. NPDC127117 TaxID=3345368 RepID=UPI00362586EE